MKLIEEQAQSAGDIESAVQTEPRTAASYEAPIRVMADRQRGIEYAHHDLLRHAEEQWEYLADVQLFTESGTWDPPGEGQLLAVHIASCGGGGGGGGGTFISGTGAVGGQGGAGAQLIDAWLTPASVPGSLSITIGEGGAAGVGGSTPTNGSNGVATATTDGTVNLRTAGGQGGRGADTPSENDARDVSARDVRRASLGGRGGRQDGPDNGLPGSSGLGLLPGVPGQNAQGGGGGGSGWFTASVQGGSSNASVGASGGQGCGAGGGGGQGGSAGALNGGQGAPGGVRVTALYRRRRNIQLREMAAVAGAAPVMWACGLNMRPNETGHVGGLQQDLLRRGSPLFSNNAFNQRRPGWICDASSWLLLDDPPIQDEADAMTVILAVDLQPPTADAILLSHSGANGTGAFRLRYASGGWTIWHDSDSSLIALPFRPGPQIIALTRPALSTGTGNTCALRVWHADGELDYDGESASVGVTVATVRSNRHKLSVTAAVNESGNALVAAGSSGAGAVHEMMIFSGVVDPRPVVERLRERIEL